VEFCTLDSSYFTILLVRRDGQVGGGADAGPWEKGTAGVNEWVLHAPVQDLLWQAPPLCTHGGAAAWTAGSPGSLTPSFSQGGPRVRSLWAAAIAGSVVCAVLVLVVVVPHAYHQTALKATFDAGSIYQDAKNTDHDHPNRIDKYGCLFAGCSGSGSDSLSVKGDRQLSVFVCVAFLGGLAFLLVHSAHPAYFSVHSCNFTSFCFISLVLSGEEQHAEAAAPHWMHLPQRISVSRQRAEHLSEHSIEECKLIFPSMILDLLQ